MPTRLYKVQYYLREDGAIQTTGAIIDPAGAYHTVTFTAKNKADVPEQLRKQVQEVADNFHGDPKNADPRQERLFPDTSGHIKAE